MRLTPIVMRAMGVTARTWSTALSGVVLAALAVQFVIDGASSAFH